ncbi:MAG: hypothetical protein LUH56_08105 [Oscillospiraceae bacterium]|nr:hypothetical protein [Oscillospiraceae bacterium]
MKNLGLKPQYRAAIYLDRAAIYLAPAAYGEAIDTERALAECMKYLKRREELKLMRIYRDNDVRVVRVPEHNGRRTPLSATGNDAWQRLLRDTEASAIETIVIYAARTVAPSISGLATLIREYFIPCEIGFIDVEADFDIKSGDVDAYLRQRTCEYRSTLYGKKAGR